MSRRQEVVTKEKRRKNGRKQERKGGWKEGIRNERDEKEEHKRATSNAIQEEVSEEIEIDLVKMGGTVPHRRIELEHVIDQLHVLIAVPTLPHAVVVWVLVACVEDAQALHCIVDFEGGPAEGQGEHGAPHRPHIHLLAYLHGRPHRGELRCAVCGTALEGCFFLRLQALLPSVH